MYEPAELLERYPSLRYLTDGCAPPITIRQNLYKKTPEEFQKQNESVLRRNSNASVVALLVVKNSIVVVERTGDHPGTALISGSVHISDQESFIEAAVREANEEAGVAIRPSNIVPFDVEIRTFINRQTGEEQHVIVGAVAALLENEQADRLTGDLSDDATAEGLVGIATYPRDSLPHLAFNDNELVQRAFGNVAVVQQIFGDIAA